MEGCSHMIEDREKTLLEIHRELLASVDFFLAETEKLQNYFEETIRPALGKNTELVDKLDKWQDRMLLQREQLLGQKILLEQRVAAIEELEKNYDTSFKFNPGDTAKIQEHEKAKEEHVKRNYQKSTGELISNIANTQKKIISETWQNENLQKIKAHVQEANPGAAQTLVGKIQKFLLNALKFVISEKTLEKFPLTKAFNEKVKRDGAETKKEAAETKTLIEKGEKAHGKVLELDEFKPPTLGAGG